MSLGRNFKLLFAGRAASYIGTYLAPIAVAFAILDLHGSATAVGLSVYRRPAIRDFAYDDEAVEPAVSPA